MKPSALPKGWPRPTAAELDLLPKRMVKIGNPADQDYHFCNNSIKTSKYEWWNFFPKFLLEEFDPKTKIANCYFLAISGMQCIPAISNTGGYPTVLIPLTMVLTIAGVFKSLEDIARHKADTKANSSKIERFNFTTKVFDTVLWSAVRVGDYIRVNSRQIVPADVVCMQVSEPNPDLPKGLCYVETKSLDGETNLKMRHVMPSLVGKIKNDEDLSRLRGRVEMEHPNNLIDSFTGVIEVEGGARAAIQPANVVLRGCVLRSTDWMVGLVVNTGHDVKIMQSNVVTIVKCSNVERMASQQVKGVIALLLTICFTGSIGQVIFNAVKGVDNMWYLDWTASPGVTWITKFFYMLLLHASFIPVSLYVSMAMVRFFQAYFMVNDREMYYEPIDCPALVRTMTLNEELGQVSHIFSDKTGTLTCNVMNFRKASINGVSYGKGITEIGRAAWKLLNKPLPEEVLQAERQATLNSVPHVSFYCPDYERATSSDETEDIAIARSISNPASAQTAAMKATLARVEQKHKIQEFYKYIAVCHEVIAEKMLGGEVKLSAPNPDDEALVCAAAYFGFSFTDRRDKFVVIYQKDKDAYIEIEVLYTIAFSSKRKRMSVIIRDTDGKIKIITKGADSMMFSRVDPGDKELIAKTAADIDQFSIEGLRCLVLAGAELDATKFNTWSKHYDEANTDLAELDKRKRGEENDLDKLEDFIESDLHVIGATAIEDRLQDGVPECVEQLAKAGIKIWVLTGDKEETAINIAVACNLVLPKEYMDQIVVNKNTAPDVVSACILFEAELKKLKSEGAAGPVRENSQSQIETPRGGRRGLAAQGSVFSFGSVYSSRDMEAVSTAVDDNGVEMVGSGGSKASLPRALIIDGQSLLGIMTNPEAKSLLLALSQQCKAVVCCRVSPDQKREIVDMIKTGVPGVRTLAVGDGANDVAMITAAHIGVGIRGEEGVQAVNASDYAIGQFRFLSPLLLKHGRFNYVRMSDVVCYMFYKNVLMSSTMFWFSFLNAFSSQKYFTEAAIQFFNLFYTSIPILLYGAYDMDLRPHDAIKYPQLYTHCIRNGHFNTVIFWSWVLHGMVESVLCSVLPLYFLTNSDPWNGMLNCFQEAGALCFTVVIIVVNLKLPFMQTNWLWKHVAVAVLSVATWIGVGYIVTNSVFIDFDFYYLWIHLLKNGSFWLSLLVIVTLIFAKDLALAAYTRFYHPTPVHILQEFNAATAANDGYSTVDNSRLASESGDEDLGKVIPF